MRITFLMPGYQWVPSGGFKVVYEYANRLVDRGHDVAVVHPRRLLHTELSEPLTLRSRLRKTFDRLINVPFVPSIKWHTVDKRVRLLYVPSSDPRYIPDGDAVIASAWQTVKDVLLCPDSKGDKFNLIQGYGNLLGPIDVINETWRMPLHRIVVSRWLLKVGKELGCKDLTYIPNAIDHEQYRLTQPIKGRPRQVAMLFSRSPVKGSADGIKALTIAKHRNPDLKVALFGVSRQQSGIPKWMKYHRNPLQSLLVNDIYNRSAIFLSSSLSEGFALPPAEAAVCGCAVVATDSGGIRDFIEHNVTGLLSRPGRPDELAKNLCTLLDNDDLRVQLAIECNKKLSSVTWNRSSDLLEQLIANARELKRSKMMRPQFDILEETPHVCSISG